jgi:hypothetical protein
MVATMLQMRIYKAGTMVNIKSVTTHKKIKVDLRSTVLKADFACNFRIPEIETGLK